MNTSRLSAMIEAVLLDFDGVIVDTEPGFFIVWLRAAEQMNLSLPWTRESLFSGRDIASLRKQLKAHWGAQVDLEAFFALTTRLWMEWVQVEGLTVLTGVRELVFWLEQTRMPYALASNSTQAAIGQCLAYAGLTELFPVIVGRDQVDRGKPEPDVFLRAAGSLGVAVEHCLVVEDSYPGLLAARRSGARAVYVGAEQKLTEDMMQLSHACFADLSQLLVYLSKSRRRKLTASGTTDLC